MEKILRVTLLIMPLTPCS